MKKIIALSMFAFLAVTAFAQSGFSTWANAASPATGGEARTVIKSDPAGVKWYGTVNRGIYSFDGTTWTQYNTSNSGLPNNWINDITFDAFNNVWLATRGGIAKFDGTNWTVYNHANSGIASDTASCIYSEGGNIWVGSKYGLSEFNASWTLYTIATGLINNVVTTINGDGLGNIWVGTMAGLSVKTPSGWLNYNLNNSNFVTDQVNVICFENPSSVWISTQNSGIFKYSGGVFTTLYSIMMGLESDFNPLGGTIALTKGPQGGVLFPGSYYGTYGLYEIVGTQPYFYAFTYPYADYIQTFDASTNTVWFGIKTVSSLDNTLFSFDYSTFTGTVALSFNTTNFNTLDVNQVRAGVLNRGDMSWDLHASAYEVPKNSGRKAVFASSLWLGGLDNGGTLHQAAMTYRQTGNDYWPGPLDTISGTTDSVTSAAYDKIWKLDRWQIDEFRANFANGNVASGAYIPAPDLINWPAVGSANYGKDMAPFVDVNGDGLYNPMTDGDYPKIKGDQMCYWIFNDNLHTHTETGGASLQVEVHASAYAYACDTITDSLKVLNYTTFYDYEIYNRSSNNYHNTYVGLWQDSDLGGYNDDYIGCNPSGNYSFTYNGDTIDDGVGGVIGYGNNPPMLSNVVLDGPLAIPGDGIDNDNDGTIDEPGEKNLMTNVLNYNNNTNPVNGNPSLATHYYNYMQSKWRDGSDVTYGGTGTGAGTPARFMYDGVPDTVGAAGWSETSLNTPFVDRRILMTSGPFNLDAQQHVNYNFAFVYTRDDKPMYSITSLYNRNKADVKKIQQWYAADNFPSCDPLATGIATHENVVDNEMLLYPNPANNLIYISYKTQSKNAVVEIYDITGQLLKSMATNAVQEQSIDIAGLSKGLYIVKLSDGKNIMVKRFIKQ